MATMVKFGMVVKGIFSEFNKQCQILISLMTRKIRLRVAGLMGYTAFHTPLLEDWGKVLWTDDFIYEISGSIYYM